MVSSLSKYFKFNYRKILIPLMQDGMARQIVYDDNENAIMATTFYLDGDISTEIKMENDYLIIEDYKDKVRAHMKEIQEKVTSLDVFYSQIKVIVFAISTLVTTLIVFYKHLDPYIGAPFSLGIPILVTLLSKYWLKAIVWLVQKLVFPLIRSYGRS